jgi:hypothetical protein
MRGTIELDPACCPDSMDQPTDIKETLRESLQQGNGEMPYTHWVLAAVEFASNGLPIGRVEEEIYDDEIAYPNNSSNANNSQA